MVPVALWKEFGFVLKWKLLMVLIWESGGFIVGSWRLDCNGRGEVVNRLLHSLGEMNHHLEMTGRRKLVSFRISVFIIYNIYDD